MPDNEKPKAQEERPKVFLGLNPQKQQQFRAIVQQLGAVNNGLLNIMDPIYKLEGDLKDAKERQAKALEDRKKLIAQIIRIRKVVQRKHGLPPTFEIDPQTGYFILDGRPVQQGQLTPVPQKPDSEKSEEELDAEAAEEEAEELPAGPRAPDE